jgi:hypothetical protein
MLWCYHTWMLWKKIGKVPHICQKRCLQAEAYEEKTLSVEKDSIRIEVEVMVELWLDYKTFL